MPRLTPFFFVWKMPLEKHLIISYDTSSLLGTPHLNINLVSFV